MVNTNLVLKVGGLKRFIFSNRGTPLECVGVVWYDLKKILLLTGDYKGEFISVDLVSGYKSVRLDKNVREEFNKLSVLLNSVSKLSNALAGDDINELSNKCLVQSKLLSNMLDGTKTFTRIFNYSLDSEKGTLIIDSVIKGIKELVIPSKIDGKLVGGIADRAFKGNTDLVKVIIEGDIYLGEGVFEDCNNLEYADLSNITNISTSFIFAGCSKLKTVKLSNLKTLKGKWSGANMFDSCSNLTDIDLSNLTEMCNECVGNRMFKNCKNLVNIDLSKLIKLDGNYAGFNMFVGCGSLTNLDLSSLSSVCGGYASDYMFEGCKNLRVNGLKCGKYKLGGVVGLERR